MDDVLELLALQVAAWNRGDLEGFLAAYADEVSFTAGGKVHRGKRETRERYVARYGEKLAGELSLVPIDVRPVGDGGALVLGRFRIVGEDSSRGVFSLLLERSATGWRIVHDHTTVS